MKVAMLREAGIPGFRAGKIPALTNPVHSHQPEWAEKAVAPYSSTLAWQIPWTEEPGRLQSMGSLGVRHDWATSLSLFTFMHWKRKRQPTPVFLPGESQGRGSLVGCRLWGRTESDTTEATKQQQQQRQPEWEASTGGAILLVNCSWFA